MDKNLRDNFISAVQQEVEVQETEGRQILPPGVDHLGYGIPSIDLAAEELECIQDGVDSVRTSIAILMAQAIIRKESQVKNKALVIAASQLLDSHTIGQLDRSVSAIDILSLSNNSSKFLVKWKVRTLGYLLDNLSNKKELKFRDADESVNREVVTAVEDYLRVEGYYFNWQLLIVEKL